VKGKFVLTIQEQSTDTPLFDVGDLLAGDGPRARRTDPVTSHAAADSTQATKEASQDYVLDLLWLTGPVADHELLERAESDFAAYPFRPRWSPSRLRTARKELVTRGRVELLPYFHLTVSGRRAQVWGVA